MPLSNYKAEDVLRHTADALVAIDADRRILALNPGAAQLTGYSPETAVGMPCRVVLQGELCGTAQCPFERVFGTEEFVTTFDTRIRNRDGKLVPVCINSSVLKNEAGEKIGMVESIRDIRHILRLIAEREAAGEEAERLALQLEAVLETSTDAVIAVDLECRVVQFNRAAEELTGYERDEVRGKHSREICKSEFCPLEFTLESGEGLPGSDLNLRVRDGSTVPVWLKTDLLRDRNRRIIGAVAVLRDRREVQELREQLREAWGFERLIGKSGPMRAIYGLLERLAPTDSTVLITGESGTGKELVADILHARSPRWDKPFVKVNCAALPESLLETELFGHVRGAFTGAVADRQGRFGLAHTGTIFLDEIGDLPLSLQVKLLRVLQERCFEPVGSTRTIHVDLRVIAATNRDLVRLVREGRFREDLFYRLSVVPVEMPPLRAHTEDIPLLTEHILRRLAGRGRPKRLTPNALQLLLDYPWPGNIRELENALEYAVVTCPDDWLRCRHLPPRLHAAPSTGSSATLSDTISHSEREALLRALRGAVSSQEAAERLGISRATLWRKMKRLGVSSMKQWSQS